MLLPDLLLTAQFLFSTDFQDRIQLVMNRILLVVVLPLLTLAFGKNNGNPGPSKSYPQNYFQSPISHAILLSGTFGELRPNHFHAGIDIKSSRGIIGDPIFAAGGGYISRIKVEPSGYGKSIAINHPNGYTTLYAHLDRFNAELEEYVKKEQYARQSFEIELMPDEHAFPISQGEQIAFMGNTGASNGAHLHFEVRETSTQNVINPLLFGLFVEDNVPPRMHSLKVYSLNENREEESSKVVSLLKAGDLYKIKGDTLAIAADQAGFGLKVYDHFDRVSNWNGIYALEMYQNDSLVYEFDLESFSFAESRYINAHCDYEERVTRNSYFNRCYTLPGNHLSIYKQQSDYGVIHLKEGAVTKISIVASDVAGNSSTLEFWAKKGSSTASPEQKDYNYLLPYDEGNTIRTEGIYLYLPPGTLYENFYLQYSSTPEHSAGYYSEVHHIQDSKTPVHTYFDIGIRPTISIPAELKPKVFVAYCEGKSIMNCGGYWENGLLRTKVRNLGDYAIMTDVTPPSVKPVSFSPNMKGFSKISFKISDNVSTAPNVKGLSYEASVDGNWLLMEYDKKTRTLTYQFDERISPGRHTFRLSVKDAVGNETIFERDFTR